MKGYFLKGKSCKTCGRFEGISPDGRRDIGIGRDGYCDRCWSTGKVPEGILRITKSQLVLGL